MKRKKITLMIGYLFCFYLAKTQVIFSEPFNEANNSTTGIDNIGAVTWTTSCPTCTTGDFFNVQSNALQCEDTNGAAYWTTGNINVSSCTNGYIVSVDIDLTAATNSFEECTAGCGCNCVDWISIEYNANGSGFIPLSSAQGGTCTQACSGGTYVLLGALTSGSAFTFTTCLPSAATLQLRIGVQTWANGEDYRIDNVSVTCNSGPCILPIELLEFDAKRIFGKTQISWKTASEKNNNYFTIERSNDAIDFQPVKKIQGAGDSYTNLSYEVYDEDKIESKIVYYRLKQTDFDGSFTYSSIVAVENSSNVNEFVVFPNPSQSGMFELTSNKRIESAISVELWDPYGQKLSEFVWEGLYSKIDISSYKIGLYFIRINENGVIKNIKVVYQ